MSRLQARICLSVSLCLQSPPRAHGLPAQSFQGILSYGLNAPHPSQLFPLMKAPLSFPGLALSREGLTPLPPFVPGHSLQAFPTWAWPPPNPLNSLPHPPFPPPPFPSARLRRPPVRSSLCQQEPHNGAGVCLSAEEGDWASGRRQEPAITGPTMGRRQGASVN